MSSPELIIPLPDPYDDVYATIFLEGDGGRAVVERATLTEGASADVTFVVNYEDRYWAMLGLIGGIIPSGKFIRRVPPMRFPPNPNLICTNLGDGEGIKPRTNAAGWVEYERYKIPAHFSVPTWDVYDGVTNPDPSGHTYTTSRFRGSAEIFVPPLGSYYYTSGSYNTKPVSESSVGLVRSRAEIQVTRHQMPYIPIQALMDSVGTVNDAPITFGDRTFPIGCLLFSTWDIDPKADPSGVRVWDILFNLMGNYSITWNEFMDPAGEWATINTKSDGTGDPPFEATDLSSLLFDTVLP